MTPVEIVALILAVAILVKMAVLIVSPKSWMGLVDGALKNTALTTAVIIALALIVGYYLLQSLTIVEIAASALLTALVMAISFYSVPDTIQALKKTIVKDGLGKYWLSIVIWIVIAVWILIALFV